MPKFKWTMEELHTISNKKLILALIDERVSDLDHYSRLSMRLRELRPWVEENVPEDGQNLISSPPVPAVSTPLPSDTEATQSTLTGEPPPKKEGPYRKPDDIKRSAHRLSVSLSPTTEENIVKDYLAGVPTEEIKRRYNTSSGELYRVLPRHNIIPSRIRGQKRLPMEHRETKTSEQESKPIYGAATEASRYLFSKTGRKRWPNLVQKEKFEKCEAEVGHEDMKWGIDWALTSGISNIKSMMTAARKRHSDLGV